MQFNPKVSFRFVSIRPSPTTLRRFNLGGISRFRIPMDSVGRITEMAQKEDEKQEERTMRANILFIGRYEEISSIFISSPRSFDFYLQKKKRKNLVSRMERKKIRANRVMRRQRFARQKNSMRNSGINIFFLKMKTQGRNSRENSNFTDLLWWIKGGKV